MKRFARNAARISMSAISGAIVALSAYSANAEFITQADFDSTAVVSDLNNLGPCCGFPTPFTVGIYTFTNDVGNVAYPGTEGVNDSPALGSGGDFYKSKAWTDLAPQRDKTQKTIRRYAVEAER